MFISNFKKNSLSIDNCGINYFLLTLFDIFAAFKIQQFYWSFMNNN